MEMLGQQPNDPLVGKLTWPYWVEHFLNSFLLLLQHGTLPYTESEHLGQRCL